MTIRDENGDLIEGIEVLGQAYPRVPFKSLSPPEDDRFAPTLDMRSAVLLALVWADTEGQTYIEKMERFIAHLIEYDYQIVPIETLVGRANLCPECGAQWCVHLQRIARMGEEGR